VWYECRYSGRLVTQRRRFGWRSSTSSFTVLSTFSRDDGMPRIIGTLVESIHYEIDRSWSRDREHTLETSEEARRYSVVVIHLDVPNIIREERHRIDQIDSRVGQEGTIIERGSLVLLCP
jgi:hypothetical protein